MTKSRKHACGKNPNSSSIVTKLLVPLDPPLIIRMIPPDACALALTPAVKGAAHRITSENSLPTGYPPANPPARWIGDICEWKPAV